MYSIFVFSIASSSILGVNEGVVRRGVAEHFAEVALVENEATEQKVPGKAAVALGVGIGAAGAAAAYYSHRYFPDNGVNTSITWMGGCDYPHMHKCGAWCCCNKGYAVRHMSGLRGYECHEVLKIPGGTGEKREERLPGSFSGEGGLPAAAIGGAKPSLWELTNPEVLAGASTVPASDSAPAGWADEIMCDGIGGRSTAGERANWLVTNGNGGKGMTLSAARQRVMREFPAEFDGTAPRSSEEAPRPEPPCHTAVEGEECYGHVKYAITRGIHDHPEWYGGLTPKSTWYDFQRASHERNLGSENNCPMPCPAPVATGGHGRPSVNKVKKNA